MKPLVVSPWAGSATVVAVTGAHVGSDGLELGSASPNSGTCSSVFAANDSATAAAVWRIFEEAGGDNLGGDTVSWYSALRPTPPCSLSPTPRDRFGSPWASCSTDSTIGVTSTVFMAAGLGLAV
ncbi:unnamed protein product, partial [Ectocarpus sp. 13 AM-2016]